MSKPDSILRLRPDMLFSRALLISLATQSVVVVVDYDDGYAKIMTCSALLVPPGALCIAWRSTIWKQIATKIGKSFSSVSQRTYSRVSHERDSKKCGGKYFPFGGGSTISIIALCGSFRTQCVGGLGSGIRNDGILASIHSPCGS